MKVGIFTSGGDSPGMNAAIYGVVKAADRANFEIVGFKEGYKGLINGDFIKIDLSTARRNIHLGGTILKTARCPEFMSQKGREMAANQLKKENIDALIAIGGDGTFKGLLAFTEQISIPMIGIPGTIDNDLNGTEFTLGFDTAVNTAVQCIDKIRDTAESHNRIFLVEVMGRDSGYIGMISGLATGADSILIPETTSDTDYLKSQIKTWEDNSSHIVVISEGDQLNASAVKDLILKDKPRADIRITILGHLQRGGSPSAIDRMLGVRFGHAAISAIASEKSLMMVGYAANKIVLSTLFDVVKDPHVEPALMDVFRNFYLD